MVPTPLVTVYEVRRVVQHGLKTIGMGAAATVYEVSPDVVLKTRNIFEAPASTSSKQNQWRIAQDILDSLQMARQERHVFRLLETQPHPNLPEAVSFVHDEGFYLRRYQPAPATNTPSNRLFWYRDILRGLGHLHRLGICHSDLRPDNILYRWGRHGPDHAVLCDFSMATPFGDPNFPPLINEPVPRTGLAPTLSDATDRFAMACLIFQMEAGSKPTLTSTPEGTLSIDSLPITGQNRLDSMMRKAWLGEYASTSDMLADAETLASEAERHGNQQDNQHIIEEPLQTLQLQVHKWRQNRFESYGCVMNQAATDVDKLDKLASMCRWEDKWWQNSSTKGDQFLHFPAS